MITVASANETVTAEYQRLRDHITTIRRNRREDLQDFRAEFDARNSDGLGPGGLGHGAARKEVTHILDRLKSHAARQGAVMRFNKTFIDGTTTVVGAGILVADTVRELRIAVEEAGDRLTCRFGNDELEGISPRQFLQNARHRLTGEIRNAKDEGEFGVAKLKLAAKEVQSARAAKLRVDNSHDEEIIAKALNRQSRRHPPPKISKHAKAAGF